MLILGIETSCDETAASVVRDGREVLSNVIASQAALHAKTGGVVPEVAAREHILKIVPVFEEALAEAAENMMTKKGKPQPVKPFPGTDCLWDDIDAIAVTKGPGLISSLIIGTETASVISYLKNKPIIPVHHIVGHIYANFLEDSCDEPVEFPALILTVSGGHNELVLMRDHGDLTILGETSDDAAGEAFDKVARMLGLGYPGGPVISEAAKKGDREAFSFPRAYLEKESLDFSFSGLKTAVLTEVKKHPRMSAKLRNDIAASFQEAVVDVLSEKMIQAFLTYKELSLKIKEMHLAGGVSANSRLREIITHKLNSLGDKTKDVRLRYPSLSYCTDNAAMIAGAGYYLYQADSKAFKKAQNVTPTTSFDLC